VRVSIYDVKPERLIAAVDDTARAVLPPRSGPDFPGARRAPEVQRLAGRLYAVSGDTWRAALGEWPDASFFTGGVAKRLLEAEAPAVAEQMKRGLVDPQSAESWIYRAAKDAAFPAAFALGYAYGAMVARGVGGSGPGAVS
jgi:hypothetical protein